MERRELIKSMGLISLAAGSTLLLSACEKQSVEPKVEPELTEREKLIINRTRMAPVDPDNPTDFELTHTPQIELLNTDSNGFTRIDVTMGSQGFIHPVGNNHWNDYIKLFVDGNLVGLNEFEANLARGFSSFLVPLDGAKLVSVEIGCNLHGIWENMLAI